MKKYFCDRCNNEIHLTKIRYVAINGAFTSSDTSRYKIREYEICIECLSDVEKVLNHIRIEQNYGSA